MEDADPGPMEAAPRSAKPTVNRVMRGALVAFAGFTVLAVVAVLGLMLWLSSVFGGENDIDDGIIDSASGVSVVITPEGNGGEAG